MRTIYQCDLDSERNNFESRSIITQQWKQHESKDSIQICWSSQLEGEDGLGCSSRLKESQKSDKFTRINELELNNIDHHNKRRQLLNSNDESLEQVCKRRQSTIDISHSLALEEAKRSIPFDSIVQKLREQETDIIEGADVKEEFSSAVLAEKKGSGYLTPRKQIGGGYQTPIKKSAYSPPRKGSKCSFREQMEINSGGKQVNKRISTRLQNDQTLIAQHKQGQQQEESIDSEMSSSSHVSEKVVQAIPLKILILVRRFLNRLKSNLFFRRMKTDHFKIINDNSYFEDEQLIESRQPRERILSNLNSQYKKKNSKRLNKMNWVSLTYDRYVKPVVISSQSDFFVLFQTLLLFATLVQIYIIPLKICFNIQEGDVSYYFMDILQTGLIFIFSADILLKFVTSYYFNGLEVRKQKDIIKNYFKTSFIIDLITILSLISSNTNSFNIGWISLAFLIRINRVHNLLNAIDDHFQLEYRFPSTFELFKLLLLIATIGHYCGCGFSYLGQLQLRNNEYNWLTFKKIDTSSWDIQYLNGLYFSFITMATVGYGDIVPQTNKEIIYTLLMTLISAGIFGYSLNTIGSIFREMQVRKSELRYSFYPSKHFNFQWEGHSKEKITNINRMNNIIVFQANIPINFNTIQPLILYNYEEMINYQYLACL